MKTATTPINNAEVGNGLRALTTVQFKLKESEIDLLSKSSDRALVCYVYSDDNGALTDATEAPFLYFWLDGTRIANIRRAGAFFQQPDDTKLTRATCGFFSSHFVPTLYQILKPIPTFALLEA